jgi:hypothetical protein
MEWFYLVPRDRISEARDAVAAASDVNGLLSEAILSFEARRADTARALMHLVLIGAMQSQESENFLLDMLNAPFADTAETPDVTDPFDREIAYRNLAMRILLVRGSTAGEGTILSIAQTHPLRRYRATAIGQLRLRATVGERAALRAMMQPRDQYLVDRPDRGDEDFAEQVEHYLDTWSIQ